VEHVNAIDLQYCKSKILIARVKDYKSVNMFGNALKSKKPKTSSLGLFLEYGGLAAQ
jgi:hypothetical protein